MFERFTDQTRRVITLAQEEARFLNHNYIGTEHFLLGLVHEGEGVAARALESLGISLESVRSQVVEIIGQGARAPSGHIPFTPRAKEVLELSLREALALGHNYIGPEHLLLGLAREGEGVGLRALRALGADESSVRRAVLELVEIDDRAGEPASVWPPHEALQQSPPGGVGWTAAPDPGSEPGLLPVLFVLVAVAAALVDRPATGLATAGLILLIGGIVVSTLDLITPAVGWGRRTVVRRQSPRRSPLVSTTLFAAGAILVVLGALAG